MKVATDPTANVDLSGVAGFASQLTLAEGVKATVRAHSVVERVQLSGGSLEEWLEAENGYDAVIADFSEMNAPSSTPAGPLYISYRGQFYVPDDKAGEWHFVGGYDDVSYLEIDGTQVGDLKLDNNWTSRKTGSRVLTVGWHDFRLFFGQHTGGWGPTLLSNSKGKFAFGWTTDASVKGSTDGSKYESFDPTTLRMRCLPTAVVRWQHDNRNCDHGSGQGNLDDWMEPTTTYDGTNQVLTTVKDLLCSTSNTQIDSRRNRLSGYVYIPTTGIWKVKGKFDDKFCMRLDGNIAVSYSSYNKEFSNTNLPMTEGWHFFDIQIADTYGGFGANYIDAKGQRCAVALCAPGSDTYLAFTEDNFTLRAYLPGLFGTTTVAKDATLTNAANEPCPIYGTLTGGGALVGSYAFAEGGVWRARADRSRMTEVVDTDGVTDRTSFLRSVKKVELVFSEKARVRFYPLCAAGELTAEEADQIVVVATSAEDAAVAVSDGWRATVVNGRVGFLNPHPDGLSIRVR